uniref:Ribosomal protein L14 n=1 Tax=Stylonychia lemnae TaxID=5949 RepID=A0A3S6K206_STYLE|nr:ribosomal protein L14 [Stylonychia lemnae]
MIFKETWLSVSDNTNVRWLQAFQLYKGFKRKTTFVGYFIKGAAKIVEPPRIEYKGFKFKFNKKGDVCRGLIIRTARHIHKKDGSLTFFYNNNIVLLKKKQDLKSKYLFGPVPLQLRRKKFLNLFKTII